MILRPALHRDLSSLYHERTIDSIIQVSYVILRFLAREPGPRLDTLDTYACICLLYTSDAADD